VVSNTYAGTALDTGVDILYNGSGTYDLYEFTFNLGTISLDAGEHWITIHNQDSELFSVAWSADNNSDGYQWDSSASYQYWNSHTAGDLAFTLEGAVPEPSSYAMIALSLFCLVTYKRKYLA
jgi:hypothetical protein